MICRFNRIQVTKDTYQRLGDRFIPELPFQFLAPLRLWLPCHPEQCCNLGRSLLPD